LQGLQLRLEVGLVLGQRVLEHLALLGVHRLGLRAELPGLQARQLERDAFDLGVLELDLAIAPGDVLVLGRERGLLGRQLCKQRCGNLGDCALAQTPEVFGLERVHVEHERHCRQPGGSRHRGNFELLRAPVFPAHARGLVVTRA
jgi:hypothetical protein